MTEVTIFDSSRLWKRVGLHELRSQIENVVSAAKRFEQALKELPSCDECAKLVAAEFDRGGFVPIVICGDRSDRK